MSSATSFNCRQTHNIHHNIFEDACAGKFAGRELLQYKAPVTGLRFINNTVIDSGGIGRLFALHGASDYEVRNNLFLRTSEAKDIWGSEVPGNVSHNFFSHITPRGEHAMTGDSGITLAEGTPLPRPYYTLNPNSPLLDNGESTARGPMDLPAPRLTSVRWKPRCHSHIQPRKPRLRIRQEQGIGAELEYISS